MSKCKHCKKPYERRDMIAGCSYECRVALANLALEKKRKKAERQAKEEVKEYKRETKRRKVAIKRREGKGGWYAELQKEVNYYAKHILYKNQPCYTCGKPQRPGDTGGAFHAGHYRSVGSTPEMRFELRNLRPQCFKCNAANSGMRKEYRDAIVRELGECELDWLDGRHPSLKEQFPEIDDIKAEIARYRKLIREQKRIDSI